MSQRKGTIPRVCIVCDEHFLAEAANAGKFCSRPCYWAHKKTVRRPLADRFWEKVNKEGPLPAHRPELGNCWVWTGHLDANGYGRIGLGGRDEGQHLAHRVSWLLHFGRWPEPFGLHHCDHPPCIRPDHLFEGDQIANVSDMIAKGRHPIGEQVPNVKLTDALVAEIRARYAAGNISQANLATEYGIHQMTVSDLVRGATWRHIS